RAASVELPDIANIELHSQGQSSRASMVNGTVSSSIVYNYLLTALAPGDHTVPPIKVTAGGETFFTTPLHFTVTDQPPPPQADERTVEEAGEAAMLQISKTADHYLGEVVPVQIKASFRGDHRAEIHAVPALESDGVIMPPLRENPRQSEEIIDGQPYNVLTWETTLIGVKAGRHQLSFSLEASLLAPLQRRAPSPFGGSRLFDSPLFDDPFFDNFLGNYQRRPLRLVSPPGSFTVVALPTEDRPDDFTGAIGNFELAVKARPVELRVGEPITLSITVSGRGNFDRVEAPRFPGGNDWKSYPPSGEFSPLQKGDNFAGEKTFTQAIIARDPDITVIPSLSLSFFDPATGRYTTRTSEPIPIRLEENPTASTVTEQPPKAEPRQEPPPPPNPGAITGLAPLKLDTGSFRADIVPYSRQGWYLATAAGSLAILFGLLGYGLYRRRLANQPHRLRQKQQRAILREDLEKLDAALEAGDTALFLRSARTAINRQIGPRFALEPAAITVADLQARLPAESPLLAIYRLAEEAAYGGGEGFDKAAMPASARQLKEELEALL
ncbi:MAG TPA: BatD family protein, partial [Desulforhopalus sp.]|nr:BatD family protein [Desulforhopalus sp.]